MVYYSSWSSIRWIFDLRHFFSGQIGNTGICLKKHHRNEWHLRLIAYIFTKISQNVCIINKHILIYRHTRCDYKLWNAFDFNAFFWYLFMSSFLSLMYQLSVFYPRGIHWVPQSLTVNYMLNFNSFSTTSPILDIMMSFDRAHQNIKNFVSGGNPLWVTLIRILKYSLSETFFIISLSKNLDIFWKHVFRSLRHWESENAKKIPRSFSHYIRKLGMPTEGPLGLGKPFCAISILFFRVFFQSCGRKQIIDMKIPQRGFS